MKQFKEYLKELFVDTPETKTDLERLRLSIIAEVDAVSLYEKFAKQTPNPKLKKVFMDIAYEEKVHIGEFETILKEMDPNYINAKKEGKKEVKKI